MSRTRKEQSVANYLIYKSVGKYFQPNQNIGNATSRFDNKMLFILRLLYFVRKLYKIHVSKLHHHGYHAAICWQTADKNRFYVKNVVVMYEKKKKTSFACGFTSIERRTIFDLWQMSYAPRSSLHSLRYASQKHLSWWTDK